MIATIGTIRGTVVGRGAVRLGAYFYPQSVAGRDMRGRSDVPYFWNESAMVQYATPLFRGHDQPRIYTIDGGRTTIWDDSSPESVERQRDLAADAGVDFFIFDTYAGCRAGRPTRELSAAVGHFASLNPRMSYALMAVLDGPRQRLPFSSTDGWPEAGRAYDLSAATAGEIAGALAPHASRPNYVRHDGRPCLWVMGSGRQVSDPAFPGFIDTLRAECERRSGTMTYVLGVVRNTGDALVAATRGFDALTGYAYLPDFSPQAEPIQDYLERLAAVMYDWDEIAAVAAVPWVPPAVVGWDASPRGRPGVDWPHVARTRAYPYAPVIHGGTAVAFAEMLRRCAAFVEQSRGPGLLPITAWNEVGEGCALLPRVRGGVVDDSYLNAVRVFSKDPDRVEVRR
jgi:hypothetical protein